MQPNHLYNLGREQYEDISVNNIEFGPVVKEDMPFKDISSGGPFVQWRGTICAVLEQGIMRNISVKLS